MINLKSCVKGCCSSLKISFKERGINIICIAILSEIQITQKFISRSVAHLELIHDPYGPCRLCEPHELLPYLAIKQG